MKALLVTVALASLLVPQPTARAAVISIGGSPAHSCYLSAEQMRHDQKAIQECSDALGASAGDDRVATYVNRGILYLLSRKIDAATRDFDAALSLDPVQPEAFLNKSVAFHNAGMSSGAVTLATRAIELRTAKPALAYFVRGLSHEDGGNLRAAYADLVRARDLDPRWRAPAEELKRYRRARR